MDWIAFVLVCIAVWVLWVIIIHLSERIVFKFIQENEQASIISFSIFQIFNTFVLKLIISFVPNSFVHWFEWLNHEVILFAFVLNIWGNIVMINFIVLIFAIWVYNVINLDCKIFQTYISFIKHSFKNMKQHYFQA